MKFDFDLTLPERGDIHVEFTACFDDFTRSWDDAEDIEIELIDEEADLGNLEKAGLADLDQSSRMIVEAEIRRLMDEATPSERESAANVAAHKADDARKEAACNF